MNLVDFIKHSIAEDIGAGDFTSLSSIAAHKQGKAKLLVKENGIIAGVELALQILNQVDSALIIQTFIKDGTHVTVGDIVFTIEGSVHSILKAERIVLNCMQRMSGIATVAKKYADAVAGTRAKILDTRKTTPLNRLIEKWAVRIGGAYNHRFGLYDMIMIKDNHVDYAGGIAQAIKAANFYLQQKNLVLQIEIETRTLDEVKQVLQTGNVNRIMLDNFKPELLKQAVELINHAYETEASGGIVLENVREYALTGVDFISVGALTHSVKSIDLSLKAF